MTLSLPRPADRSLERCSIDAQAWPDVARPPAAPFGHAAVARRLVRRAVTALPLRCRFGTEPPQGSGPSLTVHDPAAFFRRIGAHGLIGFGESYMAGEWDSDDLTGLLTVLTAHVDDLVPARCAGCAGHGCSAGPRPS